MSKSNTCQWQELFAKQAIPSSQTREFIVLSRKKCPFLYLPKSRKLAAVSLFLFPAQSHKAKLFRIVAGLAIKMGFPLPSTGVFMPSTPGCVFSALLSDLACCKGVPNFAVLVGNVDSSGLKFIFLIFDDKDRPSFAVKVGMSAQSRETVNLEAAFLAEYGGKLPSIPQLVSSTRTAEMSALALRFINGRSPSVNDSKGVGRLLASWVSGHQPTPLCTFPAWQALPRDDETFQQIDSISSGSNVTPVLMHGDFAPWNLKVTKDGSWIALDWERGQFPGIPGWDWFHYIVQSSILVRKESPKKTLLRLRSLLTSRDFQTYAALTGIRSHEKSLLLAYLLHARQLSQTEGAPQLEALLATILATPIPPR